MTVKTTNKTPTPAHIVPSTRTAVKPFTVKSDSAAWKLAAALINAPVTKNATATARAGYPVYTTDDGAAWVSDLAARLEVNLADGQTVNIWIDRDTDPDPDTRPTLGLPRPTLAPVTFDMVKRAWETDPRDPVTLYALATVCASSVTRRLSDPTAKTDATNPRKDPTHDENGNRKDPTLKSDTGAIMRQLRREVFNDTEQLDAIRENSDRATRYTFNSDGDPVRVVVDKAADKAAAALAGKTLGDGIDLVQESVVALLADADKWAALGDSWLDKSVTVHRLARRVYIDGDPAPTWDEKESTPIMEVYRDVRRYVENTRAVQTDPKNGYTYIADLVADPDHDTDPDTAALETVYRRLGKYADLGGYAVNGRHPAALAGSPAWYAGGDGCGDSYTTGADTVDTYDTILARLELTDRQTAIISYSLRGFSREKTAKTLGLGVTTVKRAVADMQTAAAKIGFTPYGWTPDTRATDPARAIEQRDPRTGALLASYDSATAAATATGTDKGSIAAAAKGKRRTAGGFAWAYSTPAAATVAADPATAPAVYAAFVAPSGATCTTAPKTTDPATVKPVFVTPDPAAPVVRIAADPAPVAAPVVTWTPTLTADERKNRAAALDKAAAALAANRAAALAGVNFGSFYAEQAARATDPARAAHWKEVEREIAARRAAK